MCGELGSNLNATDYLHQKRLRRRQRAPKAGRPHRGLYSPNDVTSDTTAAVTALQAVLRYLLFVHADGVVVQSQVEQKVLLQLRVRPRLHQGLLFLLLQHAVAVLLAHLVRSLVGSGWAFMCSDGRIGGRGGIRDWGREVGGVGGGTPAA